MNVVIKAVKFIWSKSLNHKQLQNLLSELGAHSDDLLYYSKFR
jgi:hypothetical protein